MTSHEPAAISVLCVGHSSVLRRDLRAVLAHDRLLCVVGEAAQGREAVAMAKSLRPRLVTLSLDMPVMNGLEVIEQIMAHAPTRILVITEQPLFRGLDASHEALSRGALDIVTFAGARAASPQEQQDLLRRMKLLATVPVLPHVRRPASRLAERRPEAATTKATRRPEASLVVIGASTGGPHAVGSILAQLPPDFAAPVLIVQHFIDTLAPSFVKWLDQQTPLRVAAATSGARPQPGDVLVAAGGSHVTASPQGEIKMLDLPPRSGHRPSIDVLFESVAQGMGERTVGVLLTGMGRDGVAGLAAIRRAGGRTIAQDEVSSVVYGMPQAAALAGAAERVMGMEEIAAALVRATRPHPATSSRRR